MASASASVPGSASAAASVSVLPERHAPVKALLDELDRCLNTLAPGPGPSVTTILPRLRQEFWRAAALIYTTHPPAPVSSSPASAPPPPPPQDVRNWPAWLRRRVPEPRLVATLFPVFDPMLQEIKDKPRVAQRLNRVLRVFGTRDLLFMLDFGPNIAGSETALQHLAAFNTHNRVVSLGRISQALWAEMLSRPSLPDDEPPVPEVRELTRALRSEFLWLHVL